MEYRQQSLLGDGNCTSTIPLDLLVEILYLLPPKSLIRFQSVSKLWFSTIRSKVFADLFLTRSKARPHLLLSLSCYWSKECYIFSAPEHDNNDDDKSSTVMARDDMMNLEPGFYLDSGSINGFVCFRGERPDYNPITVYNPTTRQIVKLPDVTPDGRHLYARLGYDPVEDQYKVLCLMMFDHERRNNQLEHFVCTVSSSKKEWRKIENTTGDYYHSVYGETCIDGALYYGVGKSRIVKFNFRSEMIELIKTPKEAKIHRITLINYKGKLGGVDYSCTENFMTLWVLEDDKKQEWSSMRCDLPSTWEDLLGFYVRSKGVSHTGELMVFNPYLKQELESSQLFYVCYYNFDKKSIRKAEIRGMVDGDFRRIRGIGQLNGLMTILCFPGHIENIRFL
ncbi:F-box protein At1g30790-like [Raphanus sativus]|uniref:F-box protein At1g30790-like n=1 Tax=Raphanus sativus TaxID=3726 RepID=A0A6J0KBG1_RAPSA|nr:F-box protein At1g30790-like [Raphanus sativus]